MTTQSYWAVAQTVSKMEHIVRRDIEKTDRGTFLPTYAKRWQVDGIDYAKEYPLFTGYVFFVTDGEDWAGIPDIHGVYCVLNSRVLVGEMHRLEIDNATGAHDKIGEPRFTRYYRPPVRSANGQFKRKNPRRRPRPGKRLRWAMREASRNVHAQ